MNQTDLEKTLAQHPRVVVLFTAPSWCVPCQRFKPHWQRAIDEVEEYQFVTIDVDEAPWAASKYGISSVPTVKVFHNGENVSDIDAPQGALPFMRDLRSTF